MTHISRAEEVRALLEHYSIDEDLVGSLIENNPSGDLPYHNNEHMFQVALTTAEILAREGLITGQMAVVAALYHDADYTLGATEAENIEAAVRFYQKEAARLGFHDSEEQEVVSMLIRATDFDQRQEGLKIFGDMVFNQGIPSDWIAALLDADLLCSAHAVDRQRFIEGLQEERPGVAVSPDFPPVHMLLTSSAIKIKEEGRTLAHAYEEIEKIFG